MSSGTRLAADASPLFSPRIPAGRVGLSDRRLAERQDSCFCFAPTATVQVGMTGVSVLGCEIKEEASAAGRRRGTFAPKGTHPRRPPSRGRSALTQSGERPPAGGIRSVLPDLVPLALALPPPLPQLRGHRPPPRLPLP